MLNLNDINPSLLADLKRECEAAAAEGREARIDPAAGLLAVALLDRVDDLCVEGPDGEEIGLSCYRGGEGCVIYRIHNTFTHFLMPDSEWLKGRWMTESQQQEKFYPSLPDALCALKRWAEGEAEDG